MVVIINVGGSVTAGAEEMHSKVYLETISREFEDQS